MCTRVDVDLTCSGPHNRSPGAVKKLRFFSSPRLSSYTADIDPSVRAGGAGHCRRPTTVWPLPRDASNGALSRANAPNARSSTARGRERNGHNRGGKTSTLRRQRLGMPLSRRGDALVTCSREPAMRTPPTRLVTATKAASTGDTQTDRSNRPTSSRGRV